MPIESITAAVVLIARPVFPSAGARGAHADEAYHLGPVAQRHAGRWPVAAHRQVFVQTTVPVIFTSTTPGIGTVDGHTVTLMAADTCTMKASQSGYITYAAAAKASQVLAIPPSS